MAELDEASNRRVVDLRIEGDEGEFRSSIERLSEALVQLRDEAVGSKSALESLRDVGRDALGNSLKGTAESLASAFEGLGKTGEVSLRTLGDAIRNAVGQQIKQIGALAFVRSIFELTAGFATLFLNPAEAGAHFQAAALFAVIGAAASTLGGAISVDRTSAGSAAFGASAAGEAPLDAQAPRGGFRVEIVNNGTMTENVGEIIVSTLKDALDNDRIILQSPAGGVSAA